MEDLEQKAWKHALGYLQIRPRSIHEMQKYLKQKEYSHEIVESIISRLIELAYLDDAAFARTLAAEKTRIKGHTGLRLRRDLEKYGIDESIIEAEILDTRIGNEKELGMEVAKAYIRKHPGMSVDITARRLWGHLDRKGYNASLIRRICEELGLMES